MSDFENLAEYVAYLEAMNSSLKAELQAARAQGGEVEPVAWAVMHAGEILSVEDDEAEAKDAAATWNATAFPLYTHPPAPTQGECECCGYPGHDLPKWRKALKEAAPTQGVPEGSLVVKAEWLKQVRRDLDACQKVIWMALRGECDPAYCNDAQARLAEIDAALNAQPPKDNTGEGAGS